MEFYSTALNTAAGIAGFNSQRDGILRSRKLLMKFILRVSIPNGMEFYEAQTNLSEAQSTVSIPNGMEFYPNVIMACLKD